MPLSFRTPVRPDVAPTQRPAAASLRACNALLALAFVAGCSSGTTTLSPQPKSQSWRIQAGAASSADAFDGFAYYPSTTLTIDAGDTVVWHYVGDEPHTVSLLGGTTTKLPAPNDPSVQKPAGTSSYDGSAFTSSGFLAAGATYSLRFTQPGTYKVYCLIHQPEMQQTIVVQPFGAPYPKAQAAYDAAATTAIAGDLAAAQASVATFPYAAGSLHLAAGIAPGTAATVPTSSSVLRFLSAPDASVQSTMVPVGSTVTWTNLSNNAPHTVTFGPIGSPFPNLNPFAPPSGGTTYDGSALVNSGPLFPGQSFSITFTKAGTYSYHCIFHDDAEGMVSTLVVR